MASRFPSNSLNPDDLITAIDAASDMIYVLDNTPFRAGGPLITYANRAMATEFGYSVDEIIGRSPVFACGPRTDVSTLRRLRWAMVRGSEANGEIRVYRKDGSTFWSDWRGHALGHGANKRWIVIGRNTDSRRQVEDHLAMLSTAIDHADDGVFVYGIRAGDSLPRIRYVNEAGLRQSGFGRTELLQGQRLGPLSSDDVIADISQEMRAGNSLTRRSQIPCKNGSSYWANVSYQPIRDRMGVYSQWVCIARDISEIVDREEMRNDLMAMIGHDLRNPLASILGFSELLLEELDASDSSFESVRQIRVCARRLESLADEMLTVSMLDRNEYRPQPERIRLGDVALDVLTYFAERDRIDLDAGDDPQVDVDGNAVRHVIENLLSNAVKFSSAPARVSVKVMSFADTVVLSVSDTGIGIPHADIGRIFERRTRAGNVGRRKGTGLGMNFAKKLVEMNSGQITVESVEGSGTTFLVTFPCSDRTPSP